MVHEKAVFSYPHLYRPFLSILLLIIFLRVPFGLYPLMSYQDAIDLLTPLVLIPIC